MQCREHEREWLLATINRFGSPSTGADLCVMDEIWDALGCDEHGLGEEVDTFYKHPVWVLNGLFIEGDQESLSNRHTFAEWVARQEPGSCGRCWWRIWVH